MRETHCENCGDTLLVGKHDMRPYLCDDCMEEYAADMDAMLQDEAEQMAWELWG